MLGHRCTSGRGHDSDKTNDVDNSRVMLCRDIRSDLHVEPIAGRRPGRTLQRSREKQAEVQRRPRAGAEVPLEAKARCRESRRRPSQRLRCHRDESKVVMKSKRSRHHEDLLEGKQAEAPAG